MNEVSVKRELIVLPAPCECTFFLSSAFSAVSESVSLPGVQ